MIETTERYSDLETFRRSALSPVVLVATMGALHDGHAALIVRAREISPSVVVSIFINPLQFENASDLAQYPVTIESDRRVAEAAGAKFLWTPSYEEVYPAEIAKISAGVLGTIFEGRARGGHFDGVLTVVKRLFDCVQPDVAIFGEKDFQQLFLIKKMVKDLDLKVEIVAHPTMRDHDGLALSSRNIRLSPSGKKAATVIHRALVAASDSSKPREMLHEVFQQEPRFKLDYAEVIDEHDFSIVKDGTSGLNHRAIVAGWIDEVRLIDNMRIGSDAR